MVWVLKKKKEKWKDFKKVISQVVSLSLKMV